MNDPPNTALTIGDLAYEVRTPERETDPNVAERFDSYACIAGHELESNRQRHFTLQCLPGGKWTNPDPYSPCLPFIHCQWPTFGVNDLDNRMTADDTGPIQNDTTRRLVD